MREFAEFEGGDDGTVFRDVIMLALLGFMVIVILLLPHLNPPTEATASVDPPGNVIVDVRWPDGLDSDIDLWVEAPDSRPVGYSNQSGPVFNLLRDDLGVIGDSTELNYEAAYSRGIPSGAYTVNLHLYRDRSDRLPLDATVVVKIKRSDERHAREVLTRRVELGHVGEELTVARFELDEDGRLVEGSVHDLARPLRTGR